FCQGALPVKYLGLPLISSRITKQDCYPLIDKMMARSNSWVSNSLSYAGQLQLIKSTLASMQIFWSSSFLLPASVMIECERILHRFLWGGNGSVFKQSLVKWANVCLPWQEGGLGIKRMKTWNQKYSFWSLPSTGFHSWSWRQILHLQGTALRHFIYSCGKGDRFSLWFDPWFHGTSIHALYGQRVIYDAGMIGSELLQAVIVNGQWKWPETSPHLLDIQRTQDIPISPCSDCIYWESVGQSFSSKAVWESMRDSAHTVEWANLVWHPSHISKHAFCLWLAILDAHRTGDKLLPLGIVPSARCSFNCGDNESMEHLFFACPYS
ncbi:LOW QUALITY PROTEIN: zf-RVT domain-containing protein, partial [Cephalotus follicularis]